MKKITAAKLKKMGACRSQVKLFRKLYPRGLEMPPPSDFYGRFRVLTLACMQGLSVFWYVEHARLDAAFTDAQGTFRKFQRGHLHGSGPAMIDQNGTLHYYQNGSRVGRVNAGYVLNGSVIHATGS